MSMGMSTSESSNISCSFAPILSTIRYGMSLKSTTIFPKIVKPVLFGSPSITWTKLPGRKQPKYDLLFCRVEFMVEFWGKSAMVGSFSIVWFWSIQNRKAVILYVLNKNSTFSNLKWICRCSGQPRSNYLRWRWWWVNYWPITCDVFIFLVDVCEIGKL